MRCNTIVMNYMLALDSYETFCGLVLYVNYSCQPVLESTMPFPPTYLWKVFCVMMEYFHMNLHLTTDVYCENPALFLNSITEENGHWYIFSGTPDKTAFLCVILWAWALHSHT
jgi:hypothetical protein